MERITKQPGFTPQEGEIGTCQDREIDFELFENLEVLETNTC